MSINKKSSKHHARTVSKKRRSPLSIIHSLHKAGLRIGTDGKNLQYGPVGFLSVRTRAEIREYLSRYKPELIRYLLNNGVFCRRYSDSVFVYRLISIDNGDAIVKK